MFRFAPLLLLLAVTSLRAEKPFEFASTPGKLPKDVRPTDYTIRIEPDIDHRTFTGSEEVKLDVGAATHQLVFNVLDLVISETRVDGRAVPPSALRIQPEQQLASISLPTDLASGVHTLALKFSGKINQFGAGLFYARYREENTGADKVLLGTQFEATDARRMFPCWDEPSFRARFQLTAVVPESWTAVSNMPVASEKDVPGRRREVVFQPTPPMASYLNVFCAGEFDCVESEAEGTKLRVFTTKGKGDSARYALESTAKILRYYNQYFGVPYPLPKLDQLALPGGFGGAMENWGGITYYETALLFDAKNSSAATKQVVFEVIAHEMAHQWFGDLVTMAWWDNLWLNEGFASWMGSKCTAHFNPEWEVWLQKSVPRDPTRRVGIPKEQAMEGDARITTHPIQQPVASEAEANSAFDDITYKKGQSFIRMLEAFLGEDPFRDGIRRYMHAHKFSNTTTADLWSSLSEASGKPVSEIAAGWTEQAGFPLVTVTRQGQSEVALRQERFTVPAQERGDLLWQIPLTYQIEGHGTSATLLMRDRIATLDSVPAERALKLNVNGSGNYRVQYDDASWKLLMAVLADLDVPDKVNLLSDAWSLVEAGTRPWSFYTDLVQRLPASSALAEREQIINVFAFVDRLLATTPAQDAFRRYARATLRPTLETLGLQPKAGEPTADLLLRASLVRELGLLGDQDVVKSCREMFESFRATPSTLAPDLRPAVFAVVMSHGNAETWQELRALGLQTTSAEEKQNFYFALGFARDPALIEKTLALALTDELPTSRAVYLVSQVARESGRPDLAWDFARKNLELLSAKLDALSANSYLPSLATFFSDGERIAELKSFAGKNLGPGSRKPVEIAVDEIGFRSELRTRLAKEIKGE